MRSLAAVVAILLLASSAIASEKSRFQSTAAHCTAAHEQCVTAQAAECSNKDKCFVFDPSFDYHPHSTLGVLEVEEKHGKDIIAEAASSLADIFSSSDNDIDGHEDSDNNDNDNDNDRLTKALSVPSMASDGAPIKMMDDVAQEFEGKVELMKDSSAASTTRNAR
jgi:hypothetical protein